MTLQCPITVTVTAPPTPTVTPCATYKSQRGIGANATQTQAYQASIDYFAGIIDKACSEAIVLSYQATIPTITPANITATNFSAGASTVRVGEINLTIIWKNTGGQSDSFIPQVYLNGVAQGLGEVARTLAPGDSYGNQYVITGLPAGNYTVCPLPN